MPDELPLHVSSEDAGSDGALAARIREGDRRAEAELVLRYGRGVRMVLERRVNDPELARDLYQETFAVVLQRLRQRGLDDPTRLTAFLQQTAANLAIGAFRKDGRRRTFADSEGIERVADGADNPYQRVHRDELRRAVMRLIAELDVSRDRELLLRHYVHEIDKPTLCRDYSLSAEHFDRVLFRARQRLKVLLDADGINGDAT